MTGDRYTAVEAMAYLQLIAVAIGYKVVFVEWCEDAETPGILGAWAGVTDESRRKIKVSTHGRSFVAQVAILFHELQHACGAKWGRDFPEHGLRCGGRASFGEIAMARRPDGETAPLTIAVGQ